MLVGNPSQKVEKILLALDPSSTLIESGAELQCDLIITHHPAIFRPLPSLRTDHPTGHFIARALQENIAVIGCHTNLDSVAGGVSDVLAQNLGLIQTQPLVPSNQDCSHEKPCGLGRIGSFPTPVSAESFIEKIMHGCSPPWLLEAGPRPNQVKKVAVCGGSCGDFAELAYNMGADAFITAEIKHSVARWAEDARFWIIDGGHFATENPAITVFQKQLQKIAEENNLTVEIILSSQEAPLRLVEESIRNTFQQD